MAVRRGHSSRADLGARRSSLVAALIVIVALGVSSVTTADTGHGRPLPSGRGAVHQSSAANNPPTSSTTGPFDARTTSARQPRRASGGEDQDELAAQPISLTGDHNNNNSEDSPESEAHQLYCGQCRTSCASKRDPGGQGQVSRRAAEETSTRPPPLAAGNSTGVHTRLALECHCRAVYDSRANSIKCKNMSRAEARAAQPDGARRPDVEARAVARSQAGGRPSARPRATAPADQINVHLK